MSQTVTPHNTQDYGAWLGATIREIGARRTASAQATPTIATAPAGTRPVLPPSAPGKGKSMFPGSDMFMRTALFGSRDARRNAAHRPGLPAYDPNQPIDDDNNPAPWDPARRDTDNEITAMVSDGTAAPVAITKNGRTLAGNFFTAAGHNLKASNGQPDTTRPAVLLLTGSGGRAEDQGLDMAKFYADSGASVLSLNYGGYGGSSDGEPTEKSVNQDAQAMLQHLVDLGYDPDKIIIHGYSLGGAIAGNLKEAMESPPGGQAGIDLRGLVLDRPMLSVAQGVTGKLGDSTNPLVRGGARVAASLSRQVLGKMSARKAISGSSEVDTRLVITSDTGRFADDAEKLRTALQNNTQPGRVRTAGKVAGSKSNRDHFDHKAAIAGDADAMLQLVQADRAGQPDAAVGKPVEGLSDPRMTLAAKLNTFVATIAAKVGDVAQFVLDGQTVQPGPNRLNTKIEEATTLLNDVRDALASPPTVVQNHLRPTLGAAETTLRTNLPLLYALQRNNAALGAVVPAPPRALIDSAADEGERQVQALQTAGGPSRQNLQLEQRVLDADASLRTLNAPQTHVKAQLVATTAAAIRTRRATVIRTARARVFARPTQ